MIGAFPRRPWIWLGPLAVAAVLLGWLWPIGIGGRMPVGGDVTQFQIGLMAVLGEAIRDGRLPFWNDRWGFGFPGLAESQMGVYYPPHAALFGLLPTELAYTIGMVAHVLWGAFGAWWASRRFEVSELGATLSAIAWGASGFSLIHLPHQWAYAVGCWTPWAWGLSWSILSGSGRPRTPWLLAAVLAIQILPGHFQLAFCTQVSLIVMVAAAALCGRGERLDVLRRSVAVLLPIAGAFLLAAAQVVPTMRLAELAEADRDYEYLSGFASTPLHLVSLVAPELFHRSPLWRPLAWDPFHTSPEEHLLYVGLPTLALAIIGSACPGASKAETRSLLCLVAAGLLLSLGPYVPGFRVYSQWPGFSFFRAPARWGMIVTLAMAILGGIGLDAVRDGRLRRPGRWLLAFVVVAAAWVAGVIGLFEMVLTAPSEPEPSRAIETIDRVLALLPWDDGVTADRLAEAAGAPQDDFQVRMGQPRGGFRAVPRGPLRLDRERFEVYKTELGTTAALMIAMLLLGLVSRRRSIFAFGLLALTVADLGLLGRRRPVIEAPIAPLTVQSAVLRRLERLPSGTRSIDPIRNLPMVAGASPVLSYRTLDLPILDRLTLLASAIPIDAEEASAILDAQKTTGARVRLIGPIDGGADRLLERFEATGRVEAAEIVDDPALADWSLGAVGTTRSRGRYLLLDLGPTARAWFVPESAWIDPGSADPRVIVETIGRGQALDVLGDRPERLSLTLDAEGSGRVVVAQLDDPEWEAAWIGADGAVNPSVIERVFGGWPSIRVPGPGRWTLRLRYRGRYERIGLAISAIAWAGWAAGLGRSIVRDRRRGRSERNALIEPTEG